MSAFYDNIWFIVSAAQREFWRNASGDRGDARSAEDPVEAQKFNKRILYRIWLIKSR